MNDITFLIPLIIGFGIGALGFKLQIPKGAAMNRLALGSSFVLGALLWWLATAMLLVSEHKYYFALNWATVFYFFMGLAFLTPKPLAKLGLNFIWIGLLLGFAHAYAVGCTAYWPARLLEFYAQMGLHGAPTAPGT